MRNFFLLSLILLLLFGGRKMIFSWVKPDSSLATATEKDEPKAPSVPPLVIPTPVVAVEPDLPELDKVLNRARSLEGAPYLPGGVDPGGFDCSGFVRYVYQEADIVLPRSSGGMSMVGQSISRDQVQKGDLLFFTGSDTTSMKVGHVALVLEKTDERLLMIHAASRGVVIDDYYEMAYYQDRYLSARRPYAEP